MTDPLTPQRSLSARTTATLLSTLVVVSAMILSIALAVLYATARTAASEREEADMRVAWHVLHSVGDDIRADGDQLYAGYTTLNGFNQPVDDITRLVGGDVALFLGDRAISASAGEGGARVLGSRLAPDSAGRAVLASGRAHRTRESYRGRDCFVAYDPIKDSAGRVVGVLLVAIPAEQFLGPVYRTALAGGLGAVVVAGVLTVLALRRSRRLFRPLEEICAAIGQLRAGNTGVAITGTERDDEIGALSRGLASFAEALVAQQQAEADQTLAMGVVAAQLKRLSAGALAAGVEQRLPRRFQELGRDFDAALIGLQGAVVAVAKASGAVTGALGEITRATGELAHSSQQQTDRLHATRQELTAAAKAAITTSQAMHEANGAVQEVCGSLGQSEQVLDEAMAAMRAIEGSSQEIGQIATLIDAIAFQTNLLALNAGVEAARAGDAGKGFAVVANEVRALAQRSAEAAQDVKQLIARSGEQVAGGVRTVDSIGASTRQIGERIAAISALIAELAGQADTQRQRMVAIDAAISEVDELVGRGTRRTDQVNGAVHALEQHAAALSASVGHFQLDPAPPPARLPRAA